MVILMCVYRHTQQKTEVTFVGSIIHLASGVNLYLIPDLYAHVPCSPGMYCVNRVVCHLMSVSYFLSVTSLLTKCVLQLDLERKLRALLTKEKEKAEEEAALAMGLCTGAFTLP